MELVQPSTDPMWFIFGLLAVGLVAAAGAFMWNLHKKGTANAQLVPQTMIKAGNIAHAAEDDFLLWAKKHNFLQATPFPGMMPVYWDRDDFMKDLGVMAQDRTNTTMVLLDGDPVKPGTGEVQSYYLLANGNVSKSRPTTP